MQLDERQRKMIRLAFKCRDQQLRVAVVRRLAALGRLREVPPTPPGSHAGSAVGTPLGRIERLLVRKAFVSRDPVLRRGILESIRIAKYSEDFMKAVEGQEFHNPETGNKVKFVSLPHAEQQKIYEQWSQQQSASEPSGGKKVTEHAETAQSAIMGFFPPAATSLKEIKALQAAGKPWRVSVVRPGTATGKAFWELRSDGEHVEVRWGPVGGWQQSKGVEDLDKAWKTYQSKINKGYETASDDLAQSFSGGPAGMSADSMWDALEEAHGGDPEKLAEVAQATIEQLRAMDKTAPGKWKSLAETAEGLAEKVKKIDKPKEKEEKAEKPKKEKTESVPKAGDKLTSYEQLEPGMVITKMQAGGPMTLQVVETEGEKITVRALKDSGWSPPYEAGAGLASQIDLQKWSVGEAPSIPEETKPESADEHKPSGKHKDRKELRAKPKAKMSDAVEISSELSELVLPEGMDPKRREQAKKQLSEASYQLLAQLRDNAAEALKQPKGKYMKALLSSGYTEDGVKAMHASLTKTLVPAEGKKYHPDVLKAANKYDLEAEDADEVRDFKADKPHRGKKLTPQELFQKFLAKAKPETKKRMQGMDLGDFMAMYNAIMAEEEEEGGATKTASRLPRQPHSEVSRAREEGRLGTKDDGEIITIFDAPKKAALSVEDRQIIRLAHATKDLSVRRELLALLTL